MGEAMRNGTFEKDVFSAGLAEGIRRCRAAVELTPYHLAGCSGDFINREEALAAIDAVKGE